MSSQDPYLCWSPSSASIQTANITRFMKQYGWATYADLYNYSITQIEDFWSHIWDFCGVIGQKGQKPFLENAHLLKKTRFFPNAYLNFAENLLRVRGSTVAIEFYGEDKVYQTLTYDELYQQVAKISDFLKKWGVQPGDRVAGYLPNLPQTVIAMLAATSIGAVWCSCSPDFGTAGVIDRFGQIEPKVLFLADGYYYQGKEFPSSDKLSPLLQAIPSIEKVVVIPYVQLDLPLSSNNIFKWEDLLTLSTAKNIDFSPLPFDHPLYILFSSGTTGIPKCIIHRAGGVLLQHLKEHQLHCDLKPGDRLFYFTTCGWMMWNWLVSGLASGATLILYDGSPTYPHFTTLFDIAEKSQITHFGTSAKFIDSLMKSNIDIRSSYPLSALKMIASTGSPLSPEGFEYVYQHIKKEVCLASISGGTDIVSCFMLGNPIQPVWKGELQTAGLGMQVDVYDENGSSLPPGEKGELVCRSPFPCQPLGFWKDEEGKKYQQAYFEKFPNVWHHGDFVEKTPHQGFIIHGRSDAILNPGGVRIGTAEIYRQVEQIPEILESIAIGQTWQQDVRVILFVKLKDGYQLDAPLIQRIKKQIRDNTTPRHVPAKIIQVNDIPRTRNGKIAEIAVRDTIHGRPIKNEEALLNKDALKGYVGLPELQQE